MKNFGHSLFVLFFTVIGALCHHAAGQGTGNIIYFDNKAANWGTPYIHYWGGSSTSSWPGVPMTLVAGSMYKYEVPAGTTSILFNAGNGDATKTADFTATMGNDYDRSGSQGAHVPSHLYMLGTINGLTWSNTSSGYQLTRSGNSYVGQMAVDDSGAGNGTFSLVTAVGSSWTAVNASARYGSTTSDEVAPSGVAKTIVKYAANNNPGSAPSWKAPAGVYAVTVNFDNMSLTLRQMSISLNKSVLAIGSGETASLAAIVSPGEVEGITLAWSSSNTSVATVSQDGVVTAVGKGEATITATYGLLSATCNVFIGKKQQTISWTQNIGSMSVGQTVDLSASASSGLAVEYAVVNGSVVAEFVNGNRLRALGQGLVTVEARQAGNDSYAPADPVSKTISVNLGYVVGDASGDNSIDITDATAIVAHLLGNTPSNFNAAAADMDGDGLVTVVDVTRVVEAVLDQIPVRELPRHLRLKAD